MKIGVDAMGGDFAPGAVVEGLVQVTQDYPQLDIVLAGHSDKVRFYLEKYGLAQNPHIRLVHAPSVCEMSEHSAVSLRGKKDSSITLLARLLKSKEIDAMVTPGHTGATVAATKVLVRTLPGIDRPALGASMPAVNGRFLLVDAGANVDCTPLNLTQFALMGDIYAQYLYGKKNPRVGLLSVGGEDVKGCELTKEAFKRIEKLPINFVGNVEPDSAFEGAVDVVIADGFAGNVLLKTAEGISKASVYILRKLLTKNALRVMGAALAKSAFSEMKSFGSSEKIGGAPLLGLNGICIIGHGGSTPFAVRNAIRVASECVAFGLNQRITESLAAAGDVAVREHLEDIPSSPAP